MKEKITAWELIKWLKEGGEVEHKSTKKRYGLNTSNPQRVHDFVEYPDWYIMIKPTKKIKLFRYTIRRSIGTIFQTNWTSVGFNEPDFTNTVVVLLGDVRIKTEEKFEEICE